MIFLFVELSFLNGEIADVFFKTFLLHHAVAVIFVLPDVPRLGTTDTTLQTVFRHSLGIDVLIAAHLSALHYVVGAQPRTVGGFCAVTLLCCRLPRFLLSLGGHYRNDGDVKMRSALVHVQCGSDNIVAAECVARPLYVVGNPLVELAAVDDFLHTFVVGGHNQVEAPNLPVGDFAGNPCIGYTVFDSRRKPGYPVGIFDQIVAVEMRPRQVRVSGWAVRSICLAIEFSDEFALMMCNTA